MRHRSALRLLVLLRHRLVLLRRRQVTSEDARVDGRRTDGFEWNLKRRDGRLALWLVELIYNELIYHE